MSSQDKGKQKTTDINVDKIDDTDETKSTGETGKTKMTPDDVITPPEATSPQDVTTFDGPSTLSPKGLPHSVPERISSLGDHVTPPRVIVNDGKVTSKDSEPVLSPNTKLRLSSPEFFERDVPIASVERDGSASIPPQGDLGTNMVYNEWGDLVETKTINDPPLSSNLTVIGMLRAIQKAYHHKLRSKSGELFIPQGDFTEGDSIVMHDGQRIWTDPLTVWAWNFTTITASPSLIGPGITADRRQGTNTDKPPQVLELGCGDGYWCLKLKQDNPMWIVHALDDTDHWTCNPRNMDYRDFMEARKATGTEAQNEKTDDYFGDLGSEQKYPEFTVRNLNSLLQHERPLPRNFYGLVRGREVFDRIQNFKSFIEDVRHILEPGGVIEFTEIDPRPRYDAKYLIGSSENEQKDQAQGQENTNVLDPNHPKGSNIVLDWSASIADRFKDPTDQELREAKKLAPGWVDRVEKRLQAGLRPHDGVPAARLKSWLQGGGFWDVNETIMRLPVGGKTRIGKRLMEFIEYQATELEDQVPKLKEALPPIDFKSLQTLGLFLNCHLVTGRNPCEVRMGDLRGDGQRELMTEAKYDCMARIESQAKSNHWRRATLFRFHLDDKITEMIGNISSLYGGPSHLGPDLVSTGETPEVASPTEGLSPRGISNLSARESES